MYDKTYDASNDNCEHDVSKSHIKDIDELAHNIHLSAINKGFWEHYNKAEDSMKPIYMSSHLMLCVTEIAEACEDLRTGDIEHFMEEISDTIIRLLDLSAVYTTSISSEIHRKRIINLSRPRMHGKKF